MKNVLTASMAAPFFALAAPAQADLFRAIVLSGSEALVTHALSLPGMPAQALDERGKFEAMRGYSRHPEVKPLSDFRIRPTLSFDPNVNGGVPNGSIDVAGLTFNIDPDYVGRSDVLIGLEALGAMRMNLADGLSFGVQGRASAEYAPREKVTRLSANVETCLRQQLNPSRYIHACAGAAYSSVKLSKQTAVNGTVGITQAFGATGALHAVTAEIGARHIFPSGRKDFTQGFVRLSTVSAFQRGMAVTTRLELGQAVADTQVARLRAGLGVVKDIQGRPTSLSITYSRSSGGRFLGQPRRDQNLGLTVTRQMTDKITLSATVSQTRSTAKLFNTGPSIGLGIQMNF